MPKLPAGMFKRKGRPGYYLRLYRGGRERYLALGTEYEKAVEKAEAARKGEMPTKGERVTVGQAAERWLATYVCTQRTEKGQGISEQRVRDYLVPFMGHMLLERLNGEDVRAYRLWLERTTKLSLCSIWHVLSDCRCLLNWCEDAGLVERSPFPRRVMPRLQERLPDRVTDEEAERLRSLPGLYGFVCRLALGTGLRWGELCRAQASDLERGFLLVHQTKSRKVRRVPLAPDVLAEIRTHVGRLVPFAEGSPGSFGKMVRRLAGMERFHVHQMRHTFACQWMDRGGNLGALQQMLGHASIETTQRYARMSDEVVMREARRLAVNEGGAE
jgi:integrase